MTMRRAFAIGVLVAGCHSQPRPAPVSDAECCCTYVTEYVIPADSPDQPDRYEMPVVTEWLAADRCVAEDSGRCQPTNSKVCVPP